jgi:hypothetical protein
VANIFLDIMRHVRDSAVTNYSEYLVRHFLLLILLELARDADGKGSSGACCVW